MIRVKNDSLLEDLLGMRFELYDDWLSLTRLNHSHGVEDGKATERSKGLELELLVHLSGVLNQNFLSLFEGYGNLTKIEHMGVSNQSALDGGGADLQIKNLRVIFASRFSALEMDRKEPLVMLSALGCVFRIKVENFTTHCFKNAVSVKAILQFLASIQFSLFRFQL